MSELQEPQNENQSSQDKGKKQPRKWLKRLICSISAVVFLLVLAVGGLIAALRSDTATAKLFNFVEQKMDALQLENMSGNLQDGLTLENMQFHTAGVNTQVDFAHLKFDFGCLWRAEICLEDMTVKNPQIHIDTAQLAPTTAQETSSRELKRIFLPISVRVNNILLENVAVDIDHHAIRLAHFHTALSLNNQTGLTLLPTQITDFSLISTLTDEVRKKQLDEQALAEEQAEATPNQPIDWAKVEMDLTRPLLHNLKEIELPFDFNIQDLQGKNWQYQQVSLTEKSDDNQAKTEISTTVQDIQVATFQLKARSENFETHLEQLEIHSNLGVLSGKGRMQLSGDFPLDLHLHANINDTQQDSKTRLAKTEATLRLNGMLKKQTALLLNLQGGLEASLSAQAEFNTEKTPFTLSLQSPHLVYPFVDGDPLKTKDVALNVEGNVLDYQVDLGGEVSGMGIPQSQIQLMGNGGISQANIEKLQLNALQGQAELVGNLDWKNGIKWESTVNLANVNVGAYFPQWQAVLSGNLQSQGKIHSEGWDIRIPVLDIQGKLSQRELRLKGEIGSNITELFYTPELVFNYGENHLSLRGNWGENSDFHLEINAPDLEGLVPHLGGAIVGNFNLTGRIETPTLDTELSTQNFSYQDFQLAKGSIKGHISSAEIVSGNLAVELGGLRYGEIALNNAILQVKGDEKAHQLTLRSQGNPIAADLNLSGSFDAQNERWQGELSNVLIKTKEGHITADKNFQVTYDHTSSQTEITAHCWQHQFSDLCFTESLNVGKKGNIAFQMKRLDLSLINQLIAQDNLLKGILSGQGKVNWSENSLLQVNAEVEGQHLTISQKIDYRQFRIDLSKLNIKAQLADNNLTSTTQIQLVPQGVINAELNLQDIAQNRNLSGGLNIQKVSLDLVNQLLNRNEKVSGEVYSALTFGGDLNKPLLNGNFQLRNIGTQIKALPFNVEQGELALQFHGNRSTLNGHLSSQAGRLNLRGEAHWQNLAQWQTSVNAESREFLLELPSLGKVKVSPNVTAKATPSLLALSGEVKIPWARLEIEEFPESAVAVSGDEVILDAKTAKKMTALPTQVAAKTQSGMLIQSDIKIDIGNDVKVSAYGLKSDLYGLLSLQQAKGNLGLFGQIHLKNGRYHAYGQDLLIRKGEISFSGLSTQPTLNIEAIRNPDAMDNSNMTVGVTVSGMATKPEVNVFSNPALPQDQALSYLLTGRSLENSGEMGSNGSIGAALLGLGLAKSGKTVGKIGQAFGIQDLNLGTAGVGESSKVEVSGSITPRLKIKYGVGLFDGLAEVTVRYRLLPQLYLQSVSGVNQAFDLLYQFEF